MGVTNLVTFYTVQNTIMDRIQAKLKFLFSIGSQTVFFNLKHFPLKVALRFPVLLSKKVYLRNTSGTVILRQPIKTGMIRIGFGDVGIFDDKRSRTIWEVSGKIEFEGMAQIGHGSKISVAKNGHLTIGDNLRITAESTIYASKEIRIGKNCLFSWDILMMDTDFHTIRDEFGRISNSSMPIHIGDNVWIGCRSLILKGARVPDNCIIGANTHLHKPLEKSDSLYAGNPVKLIKERISWEM